MKFKKVAVILFWIGLWMPLEKTFAVTGRFQMLLVGESLAADFISKEAARHFRKPVVFRIGSFTSARKPVLHRIFVQKLKMRNLPVLEVKSPNGNQVAVTIVKGFLETIASVQEHHILGVSETAIEQVILASLEMGETSDAESLEWIRLNSALGETF